MAKETHGSEAAKGGGGGSSKVLKKALKKERYGGSAAALPTSREARAKKLQEKKAKKKVANKAKKASEAFEAPQTNTVAVEGAADKRGEISEEAANPKKAWKADMKAKKAEKQAQAPARNEVLRAQGKQTKKELYKAKKAALKAAAVGQGTVPAKGGLAEFKVPPLDPKQRIDKKQLDCFVTGLAYTATEEHVAAHFRTAIGPCSAEVLRDRDSGKSRGMAFVTFDTAEHAARAVGLTNSVIQGRWIKVRLCDVRESEKRAAAAENAAVAERPEDCMSVVVCGLTDAMSEDDIWELFKECHPSNVNLVYDKVTGEFRRMAFVDFEAGDAVDKAVKKDGGVLKGRRIFVRYKTATPEGQPSKPEGSQKKVEGSQKKVDTKGVRPDRVKRKRDVEAHEV